jgi:hypothetical protein
LTSGSWCSNTVYSDEYTISSINISSNCPDPTYFNYGGTQNQSSFISNASFIYNFTHDTNYGSSNILNINDNQTNKYWRVKTTGTDSQSTYSMYSPYNPVNNSLNGNWTMNITAYYIGSNNYQEIEQLGLYSQYSELGYLSTESVNGIGLSLYSGSTTNKLNQASGYYGNKPICTSPSNNITNSQYVNFILTGNSTKAISCSLYVGGQLYAQNNSLSVLNNINIFNMTKTGLMAESYLSGRNIDVNWTQFTINYNSTSTNNTHIVSFNNTIPNINIAQNTTYNISINNYITSSNLSDEIFCNMTSCTPLNNFCYNYSAGYGSLNTDYFDILNYGNYLYLYSYFRNYSSNFSINCCNYYNSCASQVVLFNISSSQSFPPQKIGSLQFINLTTTNYTQPLTSIFTNFDVIEVMIANTYNLTCNYNNWTTNTNYTYIGNVTIQLQCNKNFGSLTPVLIVNSNGNNNFNSTINVTAYNSYGSVSDWFIGFNGNVTNPFSSTYPVVPYFLEVCDGTTISGFVCLMYNNLKEPFNSATDLNGNSLTTLNKLYISLIIMFLVGLGLLFGLSKISFINDTLKTWIIGIIEILLFLFLTFSVSFISVGVFIGLIVLIIFLGILFKFLGGNNNG